MGELTLLYLLYIMYRCFRSKRDVALKRFVGVSIALALGAALIQQLLKK